MNSPHLAAATEHPSHDRIYDSIIDTIGNTPLIRLRKLAADSQCGAAYR
jgi:hypothetical protein